MKRLEVSTTTVEVETNLLPDYHQRLYAAHAAEQDCDDFDLHSEDPTSLARWNLLRARSYEEQIRLVMFCQLSGRELLKQLAEVATAGQGAKDDRP